MSDTGSGGQNHDPYGQPPTGQGDYPDPFGQQSAFPQPPGQYQPPPGQFEPPPGQYQPPPGQYEPTYGQESYNIPPAGYLPPQEQKKRRIWPWLVLGIPVLLALIIGACGLLVYNFARGPIDATNAHVANLDNGDFDAAYSNLCEQVRANVPAAAWSEEARAELGGDITGYNFAAFEVVNSSASVTGTIEIDGLSRPFSFNLVQEGGEWRVCQ